jgi:TPP-dependent pyruvate/acetoin dehydrogenase alpha subunit
VAAFRTEGDPVAERPAALFPEPVGGAAHLRTVPLEVELAGNLEGVAMAVREAEPVGSLHEIREAGLTRQDLLTIYRNLLLTRGMEERGHILYKQGKIPGSFYTGRGNEAASVGVATAMGAHDVGAPLHRDMGVQVVRGVEPWRIFANYMGRAHGPTGGRTGTSTSRTTTSG